MSLKPNQDLSGLDRRELCEFASELCAKIEAEVGQMAYRGGIYEGNVSIDENGEILLGLPSEGEPTEQELLYAAPELYWHGKYTPACDVYSIGLLLYRLSEGRLPFESDTCDEKRAHRLRLQGSSFNNPLNAGRRLGDIISKALSYAPADRYRNPGEMKIMLDNCLKNLFLREEPCAETVFRKSDDDLSEMERMMVSIIETHSDFEENAGESVVDEAAAVVGPIFGETEVPQEPEEESPEEEEAPAPEARWRPCGSARKKRKSRRRSRMDLILERRTKKRNTCPFRKRCRKKRPRRKRSPTCRTELSGWSLRRRIRSWSRFM